MTHFHARLNRGTDDEWLTATQYPMKTWEWFDGQEQTY